MSDVPYRLLLRQRRLRAIGESRAFDPSKHPHKPGGSREGGQWASKMGAHGTTYSAGDKVTFQGSGYTVDSVHPGKGVVFLRDAAGKVIPAAVSSEQLASARHAPSGIIPTFASLEEAEAWGEQYLADDVVIRKDAKLAAVQESMEGLHAGLGGTRVHYLNMAWDGKAETVEVPGFGPHRIKGTNQALARSVYVQSREFGKQFPQYRAIQMRATHLANPSKVDGYARETAKAFSAQRALKADSYQMALASPERAHLRPHNERALKRLTEMKRWAGFQDSERPLFNIAAHEASHSREQYWRGKGMYGEPLPWGPDSEEWKVSEYASSSPKELFAEVGALVAEGRTAEVPEKILKDWNTFVTDHKVGVHDRN